VKGLRWSVLVIALPGCNAVLGLSASELREDAGTGEGLDAASAPGDAGSPSGSADGAPVSGGDDAGPADGASPPVGGDGGCVAACTEGAKQCGERGVQTCSRQPDGCAAWTTATCASRLVCERVEGPVCADPAFAQWPMPNVDVDVEAGAPNARHFIDNHDGTVTDTVTELVWQQLAPADTYTQMAGVAYCQGLSLAGHHDWRLPTMIELFSIVDAGRANPCIDETAFPNTPIASFWSSTPLIGSPNWGWGLTMDYGSIGTNYSSFDNQVRCVR